VCGERGGYAIYLYFNPGRGLAPVGASEHERCDAVADNNKRKRKRMTLPKKKEDIEKIVEEVQSSHAHEEHHHHHHHGEVDELLAVLELLIDSLNANIETLNSRVSRNSYEIAKIYKILGYIVAYLASKNSDEAKQYLKEALNLLSTRKEQKAQTIK